MVWRKPWTTEGGYNHLNHISLTITPLVSRANKYTAKMTYKYRSLGSSRLQLRLLRILPGGADGELRGTIIHGYLTSNPNYLAISYAWNNRSLFSDTDKGRGLDRLVVDDVSFILIGKNISSSLRQVRLVDKETDNMWIDAVCIDQENLPERSAEVLHMRTIYQMARSVQIWLGPEKNDSGLALKLISHFSSSRWEEVRSQPNPAEFTWMNSTDMEQMEYDLHNSETRTMWLAVSRLFERAWWNRTWVVQEATLANDIVFMCGNVTIDWRSLWLLLENLWAHSEWTTRVIPNGGNLLLTSAPARTILWMRQKQSTFDLLQVLYHLRPSQVSDPKDKIYGVLGLASDSESMVPRPDYAASLTQINISLLSNMTAARGDLDWLTLVHSYSGSEDKPSWLPDLSKKSSAVSMNTSRSMFGAGKFGFAACGPTAPSIEIDASVFTCSLQGILFDEIDGLGADYGHAFPPDTIIQPASNANVYGTYQEVYRAIWKTVVADQGFEGTIASWRAPPSFGVAFQRQISAILRQGDSREKRASQALNVGDWFFLNQHLQFGQRSIAEWAINMDDNVLDDNEEDLDHNLDYQFDRRFKSSVGGRRIFTTKRGYLGLADKSVQRGDRLYVFLGGRMPVVLRPVEDGFRYICECYTHGIMFGEAIDISRKESVPTENITII
ncbi:heterokaryon incompatibility protein-domain-containing protein [Xylaria castorea]|nr:heterokaryon incompatibility protein-domain-containing protein [Xylaria castorea]